MFFLLILLFEFQLLVMFQEIQKIEKKVNKDEEGASEVLLD